VRKLLICNAMGLNLLADIAKSHMKVDEKMAQCIWIKPQTYCALWFATKNDLNLLLVVSIKMPALQCGKPLDVKGRPQRKPLFAHMFNLQLHHTVAAELVYADAIHGHDFGRQRVGMAKAHGIQYKTMWIGEFEL
jgi:hypothetical protein